MVKNPPPNAGTMGLIPGWGIKISHAAGQLSLSAATKTQISAATKTLSAATKCSQINIFEKKNIGCYLL